MVLGAIAVTRSRQPVDLLRWRNSRPRQVRKRLRPEASGQVKQLRKTRLAMAREHQRHESTGITDLAPNNYRA